MAGQGFELSGMTPVCADLAVGMLIHSWHQYSFTPQICVELLLLPSGVLGARDVEVSKTVPSLRGADFQVGEMEGEERKQTINEEKITDG